MQRPCDEPPILPASIHKIPTQWLVGCRPCNRRPAKSLIPRAKLFGNPTRAQAQLSPDGTWLSWLAPKDGVLNIWVAPVGDMNAARVISDDSKRGIRFHGWMHNGTHVLYFQDENGTEDFHVFAVEVATSQSRNLTPLQGVQAQMLGLSRDFPDIVAVGLNERDKSWHDAFRLDIRTGKRELLFENRDELSRIVLDRQLNPRLATRTRAKEGGHTKFRIDNGKLVEIGVVEHEDDLTTYMRWASRATAVRSTRCRRSVATRRRCSPSTWLRASRACWRSIRRPTSEPCSRIPRRA